MLKNIIEFGDDGLNKQSALQYHIWKYCLDQRMQDEMVFTSILSMAIVLMIVLTTYAFNDFMDDVENNFNDYFVFQSTLFLRASEEQLLGFCEPAVDKLLSIQKFM